MRAAARIIAITGPTVTVQKKDGSQVEVEVELRTIANTKIDGDYAEVLYAFREA